MRKLTNTETGTWSEQHREVRVGNGKRDLEDLNKLTSFLEDRSPCTKDVNKLVEQLGGIHEQLVWWKRTRGNTTQTVKQH